MTPKLFEKIAVRPALEMLPANMSSYEAVAMLIAIALQESRLTHRRQIGGPAKSYLQFEQGGGVHGVLTHRSTKDLAADICRRLDYEPISSTVYVAMEHNDVLACVMGRLLLWTVAGPLPQRGQHQYAWDYYVSGWRPGRPHRGTWDAFYDQAWREVTQ